MSYTTQQYLRKTGILLLILLFVVLLIPHGVLAAPGDYTPLEPIPVLGGGTVSLTSYIPNLVKLIIQIAGVLAVVMIVLGGVQYLSTDAIGGKSEGKQKIENAIYGLLLAIGAYVILNTINPGTLQLQLIINPITGSSTPPTATSTPPGSSWIGRPWPASWPGGAPSPTDASVRATLIGSGFPVKIGVNRSTNCVKIGDTCTSLDGLSSSAISGLQRLSSLAEVRGGFISAPSSNATIVVTAGTEYWMHDIRKTLQQRADPSINTSDHRPGGGAIDLRRNSTIDSLIKSQTNVTGNQSCINGSLPAYRIGSAIYVQEDAAHWHVCY